MEEAYNALAWVHHLSNHQAPTEATAVKLLLQGHQRQLGRPVRFDELIQIKAHEIQIYPNSVVHSIPSNKTNQLCNGIEVVITRTGSQLCPVRSLERFMPKAGIALLDSQAIFRPIVRTKLGKKIRNSRRHTYSRLRECFKGKLKAPVQKFGLHSLREG